MCATAGAIPPLVKLLEVKYKEDGVLEAQRWSAMALWHLATLAKNRVLIESAKGIRPLIGMLADEGTEVPLLASMILPPLCHLRLCAWPPPPGAPPAEMRRRLLVAAFDWTLVGAGSVALVHFTCAEVVEIYQTLAGALS